MQEFRNIQECKGLKHAVAPGLRAQLCTQVNKAGLNKPVWLLDAWIYGFSSVKWFKTHT
jgi:hypothetical protein